jgi:DNA polymerase
MDAARRRAYLQAMGIEQFQARSTVDEAADSNRVATESAVDPEASARASTSVAPKAVPEDAVTTRDVEPVTDRSAEPMTHAAEAENHPELPPLDAYDLEGELSVLETEFGDSAFDPPAPTQPDLSELDWDGLRTRVADCRACALCESRTQTVFGVGSQNADLMIIGEAPGADEDRQGEPFVGRAGQLLNAMLRAIGMSREQVYIANILKCRPPGNRNPSADEARACRGFLDRQIALLQPKLILSLGGVSAHNLLGTDEAVGRLRRGQHALGRDGVPVLVSYHPAYLLRRPEEKAKSWDDLQRVAQALARL